MYRPSAEDFDDVHVGASSVEPFPKADHKAKKHSRPKMKLKNPRRGEKLGGGHFVFRRQEHGRITPNGQPYEHASYESAFGEAVRRQAELGGVFEVFSRSAVIDGEAVGDDWDRAPVIGDELVGEAA